MRTVTILHIPDVIQQISDTASYCTSRYRKATAAKTDICLLKSYLNSICPNYYRSLLLSLYSSYIIDRIIQVCIHDIMSVIITPNRLKNKTENMEIFRLSKDTLYILHFAS